MNEESQQLTKKERRELRRQEKMREAKQQVRARLLKKITLWSLVILGVSATIWGIKFLSMSSSHDPVQLSIDAISPLDWVKGDKEAKVVLIEYSDFQCPACAAYWPILKQLSQDYGDKVQFAYRHFPLPNHKNVKPAARAAEAAGRQGKFWEMHDLIFENQKSWSDKRNAEEDFLKYAESLGLNINQFKDDFNSKEIKGKVENDYRSGAKAGVNATPTFFLNGEKIQNPRNYEEFKGLIEKSISNNQ